MLTHSLTAWYQSQAPGAAVASSSTGYVRLIIAYEEIRTQQYGIICKALGEHVCIDAAQFDSLAHRVRNYWTNLCTPQQLSVVVQQVQRSPGLTVEDDIDPSSGRQPAAVQRTDQAASGRFPANRVGEPLAAWPTFVAYPGSRAFRPGRAGMVFDPVRGREVEPCSDEREVAMGYSKGDTAAPGVTEQQRMAVLGRCIDANAVQSILAVAAAWYRHQQWRSGVEQKRVPGFLPETQQHISSSETVALATMQLAEQELLEPSLGRYLAAMAVAAVAEAGEKGVTRHLGRCSHPALLAAAAV